jgi:hypothetical protein
MTATTKPRAKKAAPKPAPMICGVKGFDLNLSCRGFDYEIGKTYTHVGKVYACYGGFHCVTGHPLAVFGYYPPAGSRFCRVEIGGKTHSDDETKTAAEILAVGTEIGFTDLVNDAVAWVMARTHPEGESATGDLGAASATGDLGAASATGARGAAMASGCGGRVSGVDGNALFAVERKAWNGPVVSVACGVVGRDGIKAKTWYVCHGGKLVEASAL